MVRPIMLAIGLILLVGGILFALTPMNIPGLLVPEQLIAWAAIIVGAILTVIGLLAPTRVVEYHTTPVEDRVYRKRVIRRH